MKLLNTAFALGTLTRVSLGVSIQMQSLSSDEHLTSLDSNLVSRASDGTTSRVEQVMNGAVELSRASQANNERNWWGWYLMGIADSTVDLVTDAVTDTFRWGVDAHGNV